MVLETCEKSLAGGLGFAIFNLRRGRRGNGFERALFCALDGADFRHFIFCDFVRAYAAGLFDKR